MKLKKSRIISYLSIVLQMGTFCLVLFLFLFFFLHSFSRLPDSEKERKELALLHLNGLSKAMHEHEAAESMQSVFPEGACFTLTLYGLAWTNLARGYPKDVDLRARPIREALWVYGEYDKKYVLETFRDTQVKNGIFWLGQKNLLTAQLLEIMEKDQRPAEIVEAFHRNSESLSRAFRESPSKHIETYPGMCWPADNITGLVSLIIHDQLYDRDYGAAYVEWGDWTLENSDPETNLPAGQIDFKSGRLLQPARGCANSWILGLIASRDPKLAREWYANYKQHFLVKRLGFELFREYRQGLDIEADVDSGPIILGAGMAATGIGFASCVAMGDEAMAEDIHSLANMWGVPGATNYQGEDGRRYLFGLLPTGDAFLAWAYSQPTPEQHFSEAPGFLKVLWRRLLFYFLCFVVFCLFAVRGFYLKRHVNRKWRELKERSPV